MKTTNRSYVQALSTGLIQAMDEDDSIFVTGIAVDYQSGIFGSTVDALAKFGSARVFDAPAMENALTGISIGAAAMGKRPVIVHVRNDFMFLAFDQMINLAAKWKYMFGGNAGPMPIVVRGIIGKGWGQGATHSQTVQATLAHFPGLIVAMPATPQAAQDLTYSALRQNSPIVLLEHRSLYNLEAEVPERAQDVPFGKAEILRIGSDITVVASANLVVETLMAADALSEIGISVEVIDPRTLRPLDEETILASVRRTGRLMVADSDWKHYGFSSEIAALAAEKAFHNLKHPVTRLTQPNCPSPVSQPLESAFFPDANIIAGAILDLFGCPGELIKPIGPISEFHGPY